MSEYLLFSTKFGSHLYGLNGPNSDVDWKSVMLPSLDNLLLQKGNWCRNESTGDNDSRNTKDDVDNEMFSLHKFIDHACSGQMVAIDMLHATGDCVGFESGIWKDLRSKRGMFYTKDMAAFLGYVRKQAAKYSIKGSRLATMSLAKECIHFAIDDGLETLGQVILPIDEHAQWVTQTGSNGEEQLFYEICGSKLQSTLNLQMAYNIIKGKYDKYGHRAKLAEQNLGVDWKAISHAVRAAYQLADIYTEGDIVFPFEGDRRKFLLDIKNGDLHYKNEVAPVLEELVEEVLYLSEKSKYPTKADREYWDGWLIEQYERFFGIDGEIF